MTNIYYPYESYTSLEVPLSAEQRAIENAKNAIERKIQRFKRRPANKDFRLSESTFEHQM